MAFSSKSTNPNPLLRMVRQRPFALFGLPFLGLVVFSSFALSTFTQTRYDLNDSKTKSMSKEEELGMSKDRKKVDIREEYYRLNAIPTSLPASDTDAALDAAKTEHAERKTRKKFSMAPTANDDYEPVRVPRPAGMAEWGGVAGASPDAPVKGQRDTDRWV